MKKVLVANRGEIALRVMRSLKEMGIQTVAVFSEADRGAPFVRYADEAVCIGPPPSSASYLVGEKILEVAKALKVDGIHPGYGFLSENAAFASMVAKSGIVFIGPGPEAIEVMGDKLKAKSAVSAYNIPLVPGTEEPVTDFQKAIEIAEEIGFPIMIKAAAGGGGKGMRIVNKKTDLEEQMKRAISEAESSFKDGAVFIEKYVAGPRHIEIQVLADQHGNSVHLFERECSVQRRHQKVIEEAPSSVLSAEKREKMGQCALDVARSCQYVGAGTVEFLLDEKGEFYFLEMNTRLQVEHPVTEYITGIDLVKEQVKVAMGQPLSVKQEELKISGHSIEARIYAEDPTNGFLPDIGHLDVYNRPSGPGIRVDDGFEENMDVPMYYDPLIAKLIVHGKDREEAIDRMDRAIQDYSISGVATTLPFCRFVVNHQAFKSGNYDTHFVDQNFDPAEMYSRDEQTDQVAALAASLLMLEKRNSSSAEYKKQGHRISNWRRSRS